MEQTNPVHSTPTGPSRPVMLTVLCILSFIGGAYLLFNNISTYRHAEASSAIVGSALDSAKLNIQNEASENKKAADMANQVISKATELMDPAKLRRNALYGILASILTLAGAGLMFNLKKPGFWLYVVGTGVSILAPLMVFGFANMFSLGMAAVFGIIGILFTVLYSQNLKYMN